MTVTIKKWYMVFFGWMWKLPHLPVNYSRVEDQCKKAKKFERGHRRRVAIVLIAVTLPYFLVRAPSIYAVFLVLVYFVAMYQNWEFPTVPPEYRVPLEKAPSTWNFKGYSKWFHKISALRLMLTVSLANILPLILHYVLQAFRS